MGRCACVLALVVIALAVPGGGEATAGRPDVGPYERFEFSYTSTRPGTRTGFRYRVRLRTRGAEQPPVVRDLRLTFHPGTRVDLGAVRPCRATDAELAAQGLEACDRAAVVAGGSAGIHVGAATPLTLAATVFGTSTGVLVVLTDAGGGVVRALHGRLAANRRRFVVPIPAVPLAAGREAALVRFTLDIRAAGSTGRPWIRTPRRCTPARWRTTYAPRFSALGRVTLHDVTRCRAA